MLSLFIKQLLVRLPDLFLILVSPLLMFNLFPGFFTLQKLRRYIKKKPFVFSMYLTPLRLPKEDDDGSLGAPEYDTISENGLLSRNEPIRSKVSKLTEKLRKRYPATVTGQRILH